MTTSEQSPSANYRLVFHQDALTEWYALDGSVRTLLKKMLGKRLERPHVPGAALHGNLAGCYKIKLRKQGVRLVYTTEDDKLIVLVLAIDKREDSAAYKSALARLIGQANRNEPG